VKLTHKRLNRIKARKNCYLVRWSLVGPFHIVLVPLPQGRKLALPYTLCGAPSSSTPDPYSPDRHRDPQGCEECWHLFTGVAQQSPRLL